MIKLTVVLPPRLVIIRAAVGKVITHQQFSLPLEQDQFDESASKVIVAPGFAFDR